MQQTLTVQFSACTLCNSFSLLYVLYLNVLITSRALSPWSGTELYIHYTADSRCAVHHLLYMGCLYVQLCGGFGADAERSIVWASEFQRQQLHVHSEQIEL